MLAALRGEIYAPLGERGGNALEDGLGGLYARIRADALADYLGGRAPDYHYLPLLQPGLLAELGRGLVGLLFLVFKHFRILFSSREGAGHSFMPKYIQRPSISSTTNSRLW